MPKTPGSIILVIEDDDAVRRSLKFALEQEGLEVHLYESGERLLSDPDLPPTGCLVVDYAMPGMDGITLVERLRQRHVTLPALLITAKSSPAVRARALRVGFRQVLEKPLEDNSLLDGIRNALAVSA
ncbi:response regulator transcription factor [Microvirga splendida]|uniref:Response regulator n=1 Tax=Microvirga splendida TaxID=2795727 RepID=A0ABS0XZT3_9HYPH|nr:response regulator [Microvirga splendida]MBJ6125543.1 response regulator [Microvirga splendida]